MPRFCGLNTAMPLCLYTFPKQLPRLCLHSVTFRRLSLAVFIRQGQPCKRWPFIRQKATFHRLKGRILECKMRPFEIVSTTDEILPD